VSQISKTNLENDLNAYSRSVTANGTPANWRRRLGHWPMYAAAAGSALALSTAAEANTIVYSGPKNVVANPGSNPASGSYRVARVPINIDGQGHSFVLIAAQQSDANPPPCSCSYGLIELQAPAGGQVIGSGTHVKGLPFGSVISGAAHGFGANTLIAEDFIACCVTSFTKGTFGKRGLFAGIQFTEADGVHYGWIAINYSVGTFRDAVATAVSWAYNDVAGAPIQAGQIYNNVSGPIPAAAARSLDTGGQALDLLATGSNGVVAWKRRRREFILNEAPL